MSRTTATIPDELTDLIEGAVEAGIFENKSDAIRHVLREYFDENRSARIAASVSLYEAGEITLGTAAASPVSIASRCETSCEKRRWNCGSVPRIWLPRTRR